MDDIFIEVMDLQEAKTHQAALKKQGVLLEFKTHPKTCTTGCKVTVEVWAKGADEEKVRHYFGQLFEKNVRGHDARREWLQEVFDPSAEQVICQACGAIFAPTLTECPDCGLVYFN